MLLSLLAWLLVAIVAVVLVCVLVTAFITWRVESALPALGHVIEVDGATIRYLDEGSGPTIVLVHGLAGQMRHWTYSIVERLRGEFRVIVFDRPGCGYSEMAPGASSGLSGQARTIAAFMRKLGLERPLLVGHSLGGALSLAVALDHRDTIGGLALIAPLTHPVDQPPAAFRLLATLSPVRRWLTSHVLATPLSLIGGKTALAQVFAPDPIKEDFATLGGNLLMLRPKSFTAASAEMSLANDDLGPMAARYASLDCPLGVLYGSCDQILDPQLHGETLAQKVPGATIEYVEGGGHMPPQVVPDQTAAFIRAMARRVAAYASASPPAVASRK